MMPEKREQIKIGLLAVIALALLWQTWQKFSGSNSSSPEVPAVVNQQQGLPQQGTPTVPGQQGSAPLSQPVPTPNPGQPSGVSTTMSIDQADVKLNTLAIGETASHVFKLTNTGNAPLKIANISVDLGLSMQGYTTEEIPPGGSGQITVQYDGDQVSGTYTRTIHVNSNSVEGHSHLTLTAEVQ